jgi:hypothetical protein
MPTKTHADRIRELARLEYIEPAEARQESTIRIVAGDVQKAAGLSNRAALVCQTLRSRKFLNENHLVLEKWDGPPSGISKTVVFTYRLLPRAGKAPSPQPEWSFLNPRGSAKEVFSGLGGGEAFIQKEREQFHGPAHQARDDR